MASGVPFDDSKLEPEEVELFHRASEAGFFIEGYGYVFPQHVTRVSPMAHEPNFKQYLKTHFNTEFAHEGGYYYFTIEVLNKPAVIFRRELSELQDIFDNLILHLDLVLIASRQAH